MIFSINLSWRICVLAALCCSLLWPCFSASGTTVHRKGPLQVWNGYLIDLLCAQERAQEAGLGQKHTLKCMQMPACERSGFGVLLEDNRVLRFDQQGNSKIRKLLQGMDAHVKLKIQISGTESADSLVSVSTVTLLH